MSSEPMSTPEPPAPTPSATTSQVRRNFEKDPTYCPYCMRCSGLIRMRLVEPYFWRCGCGAEHDERAPVPPASAPAKCSHGFELASWTCPGPTATREEHKAASAPAATAGNTNSVSTGSSLGVPAPTGEEADFLVEIACALDQAEDNNISYWPRNAAGRLRDIASRLTAQASALAALRARESELLMLLQRVATIDEASRRYVLPLQPSGILPDALRADLRAALAPRQTDT